MNESSLEKNEMLSVKMGANTQPVRKSIVPVATMTDKSLYPPIGPEPLLLSRREVDELYELLEDVSKALDDLQIQHFLIAGSLLGAVRSESILFNDDDIDIALIDDGTSYARVKECLPERLSQWADKRSTDSKKRVKYAYQVRPWVACDRIKSSAAPRVWIDMFVLKCYDSLGELVHLVENKDNGLRQHHEYVRSIIDSIPRASFPVYHFDNRKAVELWPREFLTPSELFPLQAVKFGSLRMRGPNDSVPLLRRFFGNDCFTHYTVATHCAADKPNSQSWEESEKLPLTDRQYLPMQHSSQNKRIWSNHCQDALFARLSESEHAPQRIPKPCVSRTPVLRRSHSHFTLPAPSLSTARRAEAFPPPLTESTELFGADVRRHIGTLSGPPEFDKDLRAVMEPHVRKARLRRRDARDKNHLKMDVTVSSSVGVPYTSLRKERPFLYDIHSYPIHEVLADTLGLSDLSKIHEHHIQDKRQLLEPLRCASSRRAFHKCYDQFVTLFCIPLLHSIAMKEKVLHTSTPADSSRIVYRYQAFPCIRVIRPGELSIGPHCDAAYGHSIGNLNFHIPLTATGGTNALYTESYAGKEDWHPLTANSVGLGYLFDGARCLHFSMENTTCSTRVSLDFRVAIYRDDDSPGLCTREMLDDHFAREGPGYYDEAVIDTGFRGFSYQELFVARKRNPRVLLEPDKRVGFPFA